MIPIEPIRSDEDFAALRQASHDGAVLIFKHSTQCPISAMAHAELEKFAADADGLRIGLVRVIEERPVSQGIERDLGVQHESPQAIFLRNGEPVWHDSHRKITVAALQQALAIAKGA